MSLDNRLTQSGTSLVLYTVYSRGTLYCTLSVSGQQDFVRLLHPLSPRYPTVALTRITFSFKMKTLVNFILDRRCPRTTSLPRQRKLPLASVPLQAVDIKGSVRPGELSSVRKKECWGSPWARCRDPPPINFYNRVDHCDLADLVAAPVRRSLPRPPPCGSCLTH